MNFPKMIVFFIFVVMFYCLYSQKINGIKTRTAFGDVRIYPGIQYAKFSGRFLPPLVLERENHILESRRFAPSCFQLQHSSDFLQPAKRKQNFMTEDCLRLNIYVPEVNASGVGKAVMVWIPGEGFDFADAQQFDPSNLAAAGQVVVVTVNYRVGVFGYLTTKDQNAPANNGMLDIAAAFRWIKRNIRMFGGEPEKITAFGRFTGSMLLTMLVTSPLFYDKYRSPLFNRLILHGGIATGRYVFEQEPLLGFEELAERLGCSRVSVEESVRCLGNVSAAKLLQESALVSYVWRPVLDRSSMPKDPMVSFAEGNYDRKLSVVVGHTDDEGSICWLTHCHYYNSSYCRKMSDNAILREDFENLIVHHLHDYTKKHVPDFLVELVLHEYGASLPQVRHDFRRQYLDFCGDLYVVSKMKKLYRLLREHGTTVHYYVFNHRPSFSAYPQFIRSAHGDDVLFALGIIPENASTDEFRLQNAMMTMWSAFARNRLPSAGIAWPSAYKTNPKYVTWNRKLEATIRSMDDFSRSSNFEDKITVSFFKNFSDDVKKKY